MEHKDAKEYPLQEDDIYLMSVIEASKLVIDSQKNAVTLFRKRAIELLSTNPTDRRRKHVQYIFKFLQKLPFFKSFTRRIRYELAKCVTYESFNPSEVVYTQGADNDGNIFIIIAGSCQLSIVKSCSVSQSISDFETVLVREFFDGDFFGEAGFADESKLFRDHDIHVNSQGMEVLKLNRKDYHRLYGIVTTGWDRQIINFLRNHELFRDIKPANLLKIAKMTNIKRYRMHEVIQLQGDEVDAIYYIINGFCRVLSGNHNDIIHGRGVTLSSLGPGESFGLKEVQYKI
jgi:CRP-like cAMP-binding protein